MKLCNGGQGWRPWILHNPSLLPAHAVLKASPSTWDMGEQRAALLTIFNTTLTNQAPTVYVDPVLVGPIALNEKLGLLSFTISLSIYWQVTH